MDRALSELGTGDHLLSPTPRPRSSTNWSARRCSSARGSTSPALRSCPASAATSPKRSRSLGYRSSWSKDGTIAFAPSTNVCRHRGNKLVWNDFPNKATRGTCRQFTCKIPRMALRSRWCPEIRAAAIGVLRPRRGRLWAESGALRRVERIHLHQPRRRARGKVCVRFLGPMVNRLDGYPFDKLTERYEWVATQQQQLENLCRCVPGVLPRAVAATPQQCPRRYGDPKSWIHLRPLSTRRPAPVGCRRRDGAAGCYRRRTCIRSSGSPRVDSSARGAPRTSASCRPGSILVASSPGEISNFQISPHRDF